MNEERALSPIPIYEVEDVEDEYDDYEDVEDEYDDYEDEDED